MPAHWIKRGPEDWYHLHKVQLEHSHFDDLEGVYVIWHLGPQPAVVHVGQGVIRNELAASRNDPDIQAYSEFGLFVTWTKVAPRYLDNVEAYLVRQYKPKLWGDRDEAEPIPVELP